MILEGSVESRVKAVVARHFGVPCARVKMDAAFVGDLGGDALDLVELVYEIEAAFGVSIPRDARESLRTARDVVEYLQGRLKS